ncbi:tetratricopeptide repeat protein [Nonomuraea sp. NPDC052129]|uniref:tetratricopeptide repeat protein n=1 Tax=Nonomuraea sp. NPDC052129 TaxID=3154651 RepID=UPI0034307A73
MLIALDRPDYRLEMLQPAPPQRLPRSRRGPSYLLDVQREVVPYRPRLTEQEALRAWRDDLDEPLSVILLYAAGGQGKTRLAGHFASESHAQGWAVAQAVEKAPRLRPGAGLVDLEDERPLLVVADYAERWHLATLAQMIDGLVWDLPGRRLRLLLLARPGEQLWGNVRAQLDRTSADLASPIPLGDFASTRDRPQAYQQAAQTFADHLGLAGPLPQVPADLDHPDYASVLTLHMAALAAVCTAQEGTASPQRSGLSDYLLGHERRYWQALTPKPWPVELTERLVFLATVFGPADSTAQARALLRHANLATDPTHAWVLLEMHRQMYPPNRQDRAKITWADPTREGDAQHLLPLRPDRFGEDFIAAYLRRHAVDATEMLTALLDGRDEAAPEGVHQTLIRRCLIVLTAAAARHPCVRNLLFNLLYTRPVLARHATTDLIRLVIDHADYALATRIYDGLPSYNTDLLQASCDLALQLLEKLPTGGSAATRAYRLAAVGIRLWGVGDRRAALEPTREAVDIYRRLAEVEPGAYLPNLAGSLNNLGTRLSEVGDRRAALEPTREAVGIHRRLAEVEPDAYLPNLAGSLNNLGTRLSEVGEKRAALEPTREAVDIYRRLAEVEPDAYLPNLAMSLNNLGIWLSGVGEKRAALEPTREAVDIRRRLAEVEPGAYLPNLAMSLNNLGVRLSGVGEKRAALEPTREAVDIYRRLAEVEPGAYLPNLAGSLNNLGALLSGVGDRRAALEPTREAVDIRRRLAEVEPDAYLPNLAGSLNNLGTRLSEVGEKRAALEPTREAVDIHRRLAEVEPDAYLPNLAMSLNNLGIRLSEVGEKRAALEPTREAVDIHRRLAEVEPDAYLRELAGSLNNLGALLWGVGEKRAALVPSREAVDIYRRLAEVEPGAYLPNLAGSLNNLGIWLSGAGEKRAALEPSREAVDIYRRLAEVEPDAYLRELAGSLNNLGVRLSGAGEKRAALEPSREAVDIHRRLAEVEPGAYLPDLARSLWGYAWICNKGDADLSGGLFAVEEAISYYHLLFSVLPEAFSNLMSAAQGTAGELRAKLASVTHRKGDGDLKSNAPCSCGSGRKYKRCHGKAATPE